MAKVMQPDYPKELTEKWWDSNKGLLAKAFKGETGITAELKKARSAYDKVKWTDLDAGPYYDKAINGAKRVSPDQVETIIVDYLRDIHPKFKSLEDTFFSLSTYLKGQAKTLGTATTTKGAAKAANTMADAANKFGYAVAWGTISSNQQLWLAEMKKTAEKVEKTYATARAAVMPDFTRAATAVKAAQDKNQGLSDDQIAAGEGFTKGNYEKLCGEYLRNIGVKIKLANDPALDTAFKPLLDLVKKVWSQGGGPKENADVPKHLDNAAKIIVKFQQVGRSAGL